VSAKSPTSSKGREKWGTRLGWVQNPPAPLFRFVDGFSAYKSALHLGRQEFFWRRRRGVAVEDDKVCQHSRHQLAFFLLFELGERRAGGVGRDGRVAHISRSLRIS
jgi:hypothetical protein